MSGLKGLPKAAGELGAVFAALGAVPLAPVLAASYLGLPWEAIALAGAWAASWWARLWGAAVGRRNPPLAGGRNGRK